MLKVIYYFDNYNSKLFHKKIYDNSIKNIFYFITFYNVFLGNIEFCFFIIFKVL